MIMMIKRNICIKILFSVVLILSVILNFNYNNKATRVSATNISGKLILIDAGHGYPDSGAVGDSGVFEKDLNLAVAKKLGALFVQSGARVIYTRENDFSVAYEPEGMTIGEIKNQDMKMRKDYIKESDADIFISIHMNKFEDEKYFGAQVFYDSKNIENKNLAISIQKSLIENVDPENNRKIKDTKGGIYLLKNSDIPSVLIECGFLSNKKEETLLLSEEYQKKIAFAIFAGTMKYFDK